jgi:hypothetical protein
MSISTSVAYPREGQGDASPIPLEFGEEGTPMYLSPQILLNDSRGHTFNWEDYRAIEYSAIFDDIRPI